MGSLKVVAGWARRAAVFVSANDGMRWLAVVFCLVMAMAAQPSSAQTTYTFNSVQIEGNNQIEDGTVLSYAAIPRGTPLSAGELNAALQRVQNSGLFETVDFIPQGGSLLIRVTEYPIINTVNIEGNARIKDEQLFAVIQSKPQLVYSPSLAEADAARIAEGYASQGRIAATVTPKIIRRSEGSVDLVFEVTEGQVVENERITFVGNTAFSDSRLRRVLQTKQAGILRQFIQRDTFVPERLEFDKQVLTDFYRSRGYIDFQVLDVATEFSRERNATFITFNVREGLPYRFGTVGAASAIPEIDAAPFQSAIRLRSGSTYSPALIDENISRMEKVALDKGYSFVRVDPQITRNEADQTLDVTFVITRGPRIFVERIDIEGNATTLDRVIRRQFRTVEGDPFNPREIRESAERIRALGFFSSAEVNTRQGSTPDQVIVDVNVEEQPTGSFSFGISYGLQTGAAFAISFSENNFLGRGQAVNATITTGVDENQFSFGFTEPYLFDRDLRGSFNFDYNETTPSDWTHYYSNTVSVVPGLNFPIGEFTRLTTRAFYRYDNVFDVSKKSSDIIKVDEGSNSLFGLGYALAYDTRRVGFDPNTGFLLRFGQDFATGSAGYVRTTGLASAETKVMGEEVTLRATVEGGALNALNGVDSRITDRFFLSNNQLRGFGVRGVGPRDLNVPNEDALGGNYYAAARFEAEFPLGIPEEYGISGGAFFDMGSLWGLDNINGGLNGGDPVDPDFHLRQVIGLSIFWNTPIGPLRFNFTQAVAKEPYDDVQNFDLTISTRF